MQNTETECFLESNLLLVDLSHILTHPQTFCWNIKLFCQRVIAHREVGNIRSAISKDTLVLSMMFPAFKGTVYQKENPVIIHSPSWGFTSACWPVGFAVAPRPSAPPEIYRPLGSTLVCRRPDSVTDIRSPPPMGSSFPWSSVAPPLPQSSSLTPPQLLVAAALPCPLGPSSSPGPYSPSSPLQPASSCPGVPLVSPAMAPPSMDSAVDLCSGPSAEGFCLAPPASTWTFCYC